MMKGQGERMQKEREDVRLGVGKVWGRHVCALDGLSYPSHTGLDF